MSRIIGSETTLDTVIDAIRELQAETWRGATAICAAVIYARSYHPGDATGPAFDRAITQAAVLINMVAGNR